MTEVVIRPKDVKQVTKSFRAGSGALGFNLNRTWTLCKRCAPKMLWPIQDQDYSDWKLDDSQINNLFIKELGGLLDGGDSNWWAGDAYFCNCWYFVAFPPSICGLDRLINGLNNDLSYFRFILRIFGLLIAWINYLMHYSLGQLMALLC